MVPERRGRSRRRSAGPLCGRQCATSAKGRGGPNVCNCLIDEGRPLGTGWQEQVPNHLRRQWSKAMVVSTEGKGLGRTRSGDWQEEDRKGTTDDMSKAKGRCRNRGGVVNAGGASAEPVSGPKRHPAWRWPELAERRSSGTWEPGTPM